MGRIRTIKPEFFKSRSLARCSIPARLTFQGLWCEADDHGRGIADARLIRGVVWPLDDSMTTAKVDAHLDELAKTGHIRLYEVEGERYYEVRSWEKHQAASYRRGVAVHPSPPAETPSGRSLHDQTCKDVQNRAGTGNRELGAGNEEGAASQAPPEQKAEASRIPDPFILTAEMRQWAASEMPTVDVAAETRKFVDHWRSVPGAKAKKVDWAATWRNWVRRSPEFTGRSDRTTKSDQAVVSLQGWLDKGAPDMFAIGQGDTA